MPGDENFTTFICRPSRNSASLTFLEGGKSIFFIKNIQFPAPLDHAAPPPTTSLVKTTVC